MFKTLTPTLAVLAALIIFFLFIKPQYAELKAIQQETAEYEKATADYATFRQKLEAFEARRNGVSVVERDRLDAFVPRELDTTQALVDLESLARQNSMLFGNIDIIEPSKTGSARQASGGGASLLPENVDISFGLIGTYNQFKSFVTALEQNLTLFEVTNIVATVGEGQFMQFTVTVRTYALPSITSQ
jgi:Tfp pilus assembly protein PilO